MKNSVLYYSVGPLLYCPANHISIANTIINGRFGEGYSLALCLEDTICDANVQEAETLLVKSLQEIYHARQEHTFYLPKIFIRVRNPRQIPLLLHLLDFAKDLPCGFIAPKFSLGNADSYIAEINAANEICSMPKYIMPILESPDIVNPLERCSILFQIKEKLKALEKLVLNIRIGGNDLCNIFGFRRHADESIHKISLIHNIFCDIVAIFGTDYVISGPVWEYYQGNNWKQGMVQEIQDDILCGLTGKTVIHPNQIAIVNAAYQVSQTDYDDAQEILNWDHTNHTLVAGNSVKERMNEKKTHTNWAKKTLFLAQAYGIQKTP